MKKFNTGPHEIEIYDSIESLPVSRFHKYNKLLLIDSGIGSDLSDFDTHLERAIRFIKSSPDQAVKELDNLRQNVYFIQTEMSPKLLAFSALVKSIDGVEITDISDESLREVAKAFQQTTTKELTATFEEVKKKIDEELQIYFPPIFDDASVKEYYSHVRKRMVSLLDEIITDESKEEEVESITDLLLTFAKPSSFSGSESAEVKYDKNFEALCLMLSQKFHVNPKQFTVLEYYTAFEELKKSAKKNV